MKGKLSTQKKGTIIATINNNNSVYFYRILGKSSYAINGEKIASVKVFDYYYNEYDEIMDSLVDYSGCSYFTKECKPELFINFKY